MLDRFADGPTGALALLAAGLALVVCGGSACWCRLRRKAGRECAEAPRRW